MLPLLELASDGNEWTMRDAREALAGRLKLTPEDRLVLLPSGRQALFNNRVAWAKGYLVYAGLMSSEKRGRFQITARGRDILKQKPTAINIKFLEQFPEFLSSGLPGIGARHQGRLRALPRYQARRLRKQ